MSLIKNLFNEQQRYLSFFFSHLDYEAAEKVFAKISSCKGKIVFMGVGKSGMVAEKLANTLISTGTPSTFLSPLEAFHGNLGLLNSEDLVIMISKSGETGELIHLIPNLRKRQVQIMAWISNNQSRLAKLVDHTMYLPVERELCPFDLAPTTSTAVQLLFGDALAIALMQLKKFSLSDYALNHPGGMIGKQISLRVEDLMIKKQDLPLCLPQALLLDVLFELSKKRLGLLLVVDEKEELKGIFTDGDLRRSLENYGAAALQQPVSKLMTTSPLTIKKECLIKEALKEMQKNEQQIITSLPVIENERIIGLIRMHEITKEG